MCEYPHSVRSTISHFSSNFCFSFRLHIPLKMSYTPLAAIFRALTCAFLSPLLSVGSKILAGPEHCAPEQALGVQPTGAGLRPAGAHRSKPPAYLCPPVQASGLPTGARPRGAGHWNISLKRTVCHFFTPANAMPTINCQHNILSMHVG